MLRDMESESEALSVTWKRTQARLPAGWALESLRCASSGLNLQDRSDDWIAVAVTQDGGERRYRAHDPVAALDGLADSFMSN
jgi:hypothetical protein